VEIDRGTRDAGKCSQGKRPDRIDNIKSSMATAGGLERDSLMQEEAYLSSLLDCCCRCEFKSYNYIFDNDACSQCKAKGPPER
jgi:hypothetical protein